MRSVFAVVCGLAGRCLPDVIATTFYASFRGRVAIDAAKKLAGFVLGITEILFILKSVVSVCWWTAESSGAKLAYLLVIHCRHQYKACQFPVSMLAAKQLGGGSCIPSRRAIVVDLIMM